MKKGKLLSILSLIFGVIGLIGSMILFGIIPAIAGFVMGMIAIVSKREGKVIAIIGTIISAIAVIWTLILIIVGLSLPDKTEKTVGPASETKIEESAEQNDISSQVEIIAQKTEDNLLCVFVTNNADITIAEIDFQVNFKDESGQIIKTEEDGHDAVLSGSTVVSRISTPDNYADYEISKKVIPDDNDYVNHAADITVTSNQGDDCVIVQATNNSGVDIEELELVVVFYNGESIASVTHAKDIYDFTQGDTITQEFNTYSTIVYDRFEVYVNQAHTF
ncbi:DUF4190 domain-containing protein [Bariatricus massiliensis]|uniref:DUF4190 domain-containing protein n=1 Tax=Bariatricus massiliensis TaxID=1745713 RepID=A0ABS8DGY1_9FIRM|nr:DUF4190 domain-containing protein [Bariatricus massiliensis]MCB7304570.1 DUF4190 domain-containing protein [Bariatricus massiliensis]MCB7375222.1 DUF4190 domain-containing protein [Bariatricus massiliensis]MCB7387681.1 DUF4190 domain-containing protein [Bariatricus massiliensis]MCB7411842.1 DUF4190 domain-containing protein [Bariatricus massiliensis]MCQ5253978.1 DUF4190 domain-containing protein [Bariatricus massiliensis]